MIYFNANGRSAECSSDEPITTGSVGIPVEFTFSSEWDGLAKTAVFQTDSTVIDVYIPDDACVVPPEAITRVGRRLVIGVYGANGIDVVIPTVYASAGFIMKGAEPSGIEPTPQTQSLVDQILAAAQAAQDAAEDAVEAAEDAQETAQSVRDDADAGAFDGEDGASAYQIAVSHGYVGTEEEWLASLHGKDGEASIAKTVSGEILAIEDGTEDKPKALSVEIPYQADGISGFTMRFRRRNMLDLTGAISSAGIRFSPQTDGTLLVDGTATGNSRYGCYGSTSYGSAANCYNLPAGRYTMFAYYPETGNYSNAMAIYKGTSTTQIKVIDGLTSFTTAESQLARAIIKYTSGTSFTDRAALVFLGVGDLTADDWDAPATTRYELAVDIGQTVYGGTADLTGGVFRSKYASDGTELAEPVEIPITAELPTLYEGVNTIWASVIGSVVTMTYGKAVKDYVDEQTDAIQTEIDTLDATTQGQLTGEYSSIGMFAKIGVIGDSYAQGSIHYPGGSGVYKPLSWGKHLERDLSIGVTLYTHGGYATRDWITDTTYGLPKLEADAVTSPCDLYWFGLGINDSAYYDDHPDYLGSITDISSRVSGDPWAATFYGNCGQIIERIQAAAPSAKIVIASFVADRPKAPRTWDTALNNALETIAGYYGLPFLDLRSDPFYMSDFYTAQCYGDHPTAIGYAGMAQANERLFARAAVEYRSYFMDYHNATAFPSGGSGGTGDYADLTNKPSINNVTLSGNKTATDLDLEPEAMVVTVTDTGGAALHADKNAQQIYDAFAAGMRVVAYFGGVAYTLVITDERGIQAVFSAALQGRIYYLSVDQSGNAMPSSWQPGSYSKPSGGIPKSDLASAVQTSLGKADTALQSVPSTYRTAAAQDSIDAAQDTAIAGKYTKPSGGIPASDLASGVIPTVPTKTSDLTNDSGFVNAAGAAAAAPVSSVNGQTGAVTLTIPTTAADVGAIAAPSSPATGAFLVWNGSAWTAQTLATWQASSY